MARTPLMRALQRLAREHREAETMGIGPAELRERQAEGALTRRELVKRGGIIGAAVMLGGPAALARPGRAAVGWNRSRIAIVGGGIAGLTAALRLQDKGVGATVYEASDRIGGRMHSDRSGYFSNGQVAEFCGELIDTGHRTIRSLAKRFGLPLTDLLAAEPNGTDDTYWFLDGYYPVDQADADFKAISAALAADLKAAGYPTLYNSYTDAGRALDHLSVRDWIDSRVLGGHSSRLGRLLDAAYTEEYGADTSDQASLNLIYLLAYQPTANSFSIFGASDERFHIAGGNEQLPEAIAATLPDVRTSWRMTSIAANRDGSVSLSFSTDSGSTTVTADQVILALPFSVLRTLDYSGAGFDALKRTAITQLGAGRNTKLQLQFKDSSWNGQGPWGRSNGNVYTDIGIQNTWESTRGQNGASGILNDYSGGSVAASYHPSTPYSNAAQNPQVTAYATAFLSQLETVFPGITKHWNGKASLSTPFRDPNLLCSYAYWRVGQYTGFSGYEAAPQGNVHFAGEHCSTDFQGYMEGGASEGIRAANEVLDALK
ncbi:MAG: FAD-dependent oxidoreductase [Gaiellaceae bacterium]